MSGGLRGSASVCGSRAFWLGGVGLVERYVSSSAILQQDWMINSIQYDKRREQGSQAGESCLESDGSRCLRSLESIRSINAVSLNGAKMPTLAEPAIDLPPVLRDAVAHFEG